MHIIIRVTLFFNFYTHMIIPTLQKEYDTITETISMI